ncbi:MAG: hypothetical protein AAF211_25225, partial [Myxococcota bacterium]
MNISPIIAIPPLPEGTPSGPATQEPPPPASPAIPEVSAVAAAEGARATDKERNRSDHPDDDRPDGHDPPPGQVPSDEADPTGARDPVVELEPRTVSGELSIDASPATDLQQTIRSMRQVRSAALASDRPTSQD